MLCYVVVVVREKEGLLDIHTKGTPWSLVQKTSHSGLTPEAMAVGRHGNYLYIYLKYACNVLYIKREYRARYT